MNADALTSLFEPLGWTLVHSMWQFSIIGILLLVALRGLRKSRPQASYLASCAALVLMMTVSAGTFTALRSAHSISMSPLPRVQTGAPLPTGSASANPSHGKFDEVSRAGVNGSEPSERAGPSESDEATRIGFRIVTLSSDQVVSWIRPWLGCLSFLWAFGVTLLSIRLLMGWHCHGRLRRTRFEEVADEVVVAAKRISKKLGIRRAVYIVKSSHVTAPATIGTIKPLILMPACVLTGMTWQQLEAVIAHELAHIKRHDYLVNALQMCVETLLFYHPATWWVSSKIRQYREECCDEIAVFATRKRVEYAKMLMWLDERLPPIAPSEMSLSSAGGTLLVRVRKVLKADPGEATVHGAASWVSILFVAAVTLGCFGYSAVVAFDRGNGRLTSNGVLSTNAALEPVIAALAQSLSEHIDLVDNAALAGSLAREMGSCLGDRVSSDPDPATMRKLTSHVQRRVSAWQPTATSELQRDLDILCWELSAIATQRPLSEKELRRREGERDWMRRYIRQLPETDRERAVEAWQHGGRLSLLNHEVFANPLFHVPMGKIAFEKFQNKLREYQQRARLGRLTFAPAHMLAAAAQVKGAIHLTTPMSTFPSSLFSSSCHCFLVDNENLAQVFDADSNTVTCTVISDRGIGTSHFEAAAISKNRQGDLRWDAVSGKLFPVGGAALAVLDETDWDRMDSLSTEALHVRIATDSIDSFRVVPDDPFVCRKPVTLVLQSNDGRLVFVRLQQFINDAVYLQIRPYPLPVGYPSFNSCKDCSSWHDAKVVPADSSG